MLRCQVSGIRRYHVQVGRESGGFAWSSLAVIKPQGRDASSWTGYQCLSGDGK
jgi:hypothetical protein